MERRMKRNDRLAMRALVAVALGTLLWFLRPKRVRAPHEPI
jgi:hypothetical protein